MEYSPPPWSIRKSGTGRTTIVATDNLEVAFILSHHKFGEGNAFLIAAAPHLLQALEAIVDGIRDPALLKIAKSAIARPQGMEERG
jgi:hypothetical protein